MNQQELKTILEDHKKWLSDDGGNRADLRGADLRGSYLQDADLRGADLQDADLQDADLRGADLRGAYLRGANLRGADLQDADLRCANLQGANLQDANLRDADLEYIKVSFQTTGYFLACPKEDAFTAWKNINGTLVELLIQKGVPRSSATTAKCRALCARVIKVYNEVGEVSSNQYGPKTTYKNGCMVFADKWDNDRWNECSHGIHFFMHREQAESWFQ